MDDEAESDDPSVVSVAGSVDASSVSLDAESVESSSEASLESPSWSSVLESVFFFFEVDDLEEDFFAVVSALAVSCASVVVVEPELQARETSTKSRTKMARTATAAPIRNLGSNPARIDAEDAPLVGLESRRPPRSRDVETRRAPRSRYASRPVGRLRPEVRDGVRRYPSERSEVDPLRCIRERSPGWDRREPCAEREPLARRVLRMRPYSP